MTTTTLRRARLLAVVVLAGGLVASGCTHPGPPGHPGPTTTRPGPPPTSRPWHSPIDGSWTLVPASLGVGVPPGAEFTAKLSGGSIGGRSGCNSYFGELTVGRDGSFDAHDLGGTDMACEPQLMNAEAAFVKALDAATAYRVEGDELRLTGPQVALRFRRAGVIAPDGPVGHWIVTQYVDGRTAALVATIPGATITLDIEAGGSLGGRACNSYGASWSVTGGRLSIGPVMATKMYCSAPEGTMEQETQYFAALQDATGWQVDGDQLVLTSGEGRGRILVTAETNRIVRPAG